MSIRHGLLALLERARCTATSSVPRSRSPPVDLALNIGQVYTTLARLERDGLVRPLPENESGQRPYEITDADGRTWRCGSPRRSAAPTGPVTSCRSSWRWR
ncbi:helix-turn-helix transcriptional regulator [Micromonospora sp. b486]|nr:helix-turn-helix transcriptional regulator [Micromonospora sp. b486]MDM4777924.1 helix-turn-helix transcriptional regulator [Micromonospora sp. b486]